MKRWLLLLGVAGVALAGCGAKRDLQSVEGKHPPKPAAAAAPRTFEQMITPPPQAAPDRVNDPLRRSEPRPDDKFDLPPAG